MGGGDNSSPIRLKQTKFTICVMKSEKKTFLEFEISLAKFFIVLLEYAKYHNLQIFILIVIENIHDFEEIYWALFGRP